MKLAKGKDERKELKEQERKMVEVEVLGQQPEPVCVHRPCDFSFVLFIEITVSPQ